LPTVRRPGLAAALPLALRGGQSCPPRGGQDWPPRCHSHCAAGNPAHRAAAFPGRRERSSCLFLVAWEGHQADKKAK